MTIKELLLKTTAMVVLGTKVMIGDDTTDELVILKGQDEIYRGNDEDKAVEILLETE